jgi:hypothetical protein
MAITTFTVSKNAGWARTDVILQLEEAFTWLGWHGDTISGIVTSFQFSGGGSGSAMAFKTYEDVFPSTTSGIGTGASFFIGRTSDGSLSQVYVNRPGVGYTDGEYVTLSAEDIGGSANGATGIGITVQVAGGGSPVGYGTTTAFFDKGLTAGATNPWGVLKLEIDPNKNYGTTYRGFQVTTDTSLNIRSGSAFHPADTSNLSSGGNAYPNRFAGASGVDFSELITNFQSYYQNNTSSTAVQTGFTFANSTSYQLDLNVFRSGIDPNFAVISFKHPTLSSSYITQNTFQTFIVHNFTNSLYDLDYLFLGGTTLITPQPQSYPGLLFETFTSGTSGDAIRTAEFGHCNDNASNAKRSVYYGSTPTINFVDPTFQNSIYRRSAANSTKNNSSLPSEVYFNPVIKGLPLNPLLIPSPYYIPDDFVLVDFDINTPSVNIQQGDTITISGSEVYTVITASYSQDTRTRGIAFCARTV